MSAIYVDTETLGLDPRTAELRILSIDGEAYDLWDEYAREEAIPRLFEGQHKTFVAHNAQFDLDFLAEHLGYEHRGPIFDTMVAWQLIMNGRRAVDGSPMPANLGYVAERVAKVPLDKSYQRIDWGGFILEPAAIEYAAKDTEILKVLHEKLDAALHMGRLQDVMKLEMALLPVLLGMRRKGVRLRYNQARELRKRLLKEVDEITEDLPERLNPRSPAQIAEYFGIPDSKEDTLREFVLRTNNKTAKVVMDARKRLKKASSIEKQLLKRIRKDGRIHPSFLQTSTETGRLSSREPNLQNQDSGDDVRGLFVPFDGGRFVIADYSQLELRLAAYFSRDPAMLRAYAEGRDLHTETQDRIFGERTKRTRTLAKNINFGLVFGGGHTTLQTFAAKSGVQISEEEAKLYRDAFREAYPRLYRWQKEEGDVRKKYIYTAIGRRRYVTPGQGYCARINNIVQGSAADGMKIAMVRLHKYRNIPIILSVHDELVAETHEVDVERVSDIMQEEMALAMYRATKQDPKKPIVPIVAEVDIGRSWADKH